MTKEFRMGDGGAKSDADGSLPDITEFRKALQADQGRCGGHFAGAHLHE
jgi:hypothetical protein